MLVNIILNAYEKNSWIDKSMNTNRKSGERIRLDIYVNKENICINRQTYTVIALQIQIYLGLLNGKKMKYLIN